ncbi:winged helix-turn-helix transcriptional regulator [Streptomyces sp. NPDC021020]|uniref:winged helix-turn-helix transcriptional regulator n=1 Tax=Streptomyces sp. NPDC021020 TaxID=3365109 RepID=UPI0037ADBBFF
MKSIEDLIIFDQELKVGARLVGMFLEVMDDPQSTRQVAADLGISESSALRYLKALEEKGRARRVHPLWTSVEDPA